MKISHLLPITAIVAGCSTVPPPKPLEPLWEPPPRVKVLVPEQLEVCAGRVDTILEYPYGDGLTLQIERIDRCTDPLGEFLYKKKILRRGQLVFAPWVKLPPGIRQRVLDVLVTQWEWGAQEVMVWGKILLGKKKEQLLDRIDELESSGSIETMK